MPTKQQILNLLPAYLGNIKVIVEEQKTSDIVNEILKAHEFYKKDYDKICDLFYTGNLKTICKKIFDFLKQNVPYKIESGHKQKICSPAAILKQDAGVDCKNYALFTNGILDAIRRRYNEDFDLVFRFAGYSKKQIEHVYSVVANDDIEIWNDAVLNTFNERLQPIYIKDKKIKNMALLSVNGIPPLNNNQIKNLAAKNNVPPFVYAGKIAPQSIGIIPPIDPFAFFGTDINKTINEIISFFKDWGLSDGEKIKKGFIQQGFTPDQMVLWYIKNAPKMADPWANFHQAKEILIWDTPNISYNVADAFNTLIDKPEWQNVNVRYDVPFNLSQTNKTPFWLPVEFRGKNYVAATDPTTGGGSEQPQQAKSNLLKIAVGLLLLKSFV